MKDVQGTRQFFPIHFHHLIIFVPLVKSLIILDHLSFSSIIELALQLLALGHTTISVSIPFNGSLRQTPFETTWLLPPQHGMPMTFLRQNQGMPGPGLPRVCGSWPRKHTRKPSGASKSARVARSSCGHQNMAIDPKTRQNYGKVWDVNGMDPAKHTDFVEVWTLLD